MPEKGSQSKPVGNIHLRQARKNPKQFELCTSKERTVPVDAQQERAYAPVVQLKRNGWSSRAKCCKARPDCSEEPFEAWDRCTLRIAQRIQQVSEDLLHLNQARSIALLRLEQRDDLLQMGFIGEQPQSKYYTLTRTAENNCSPKTESWERMTALMTRLLARPKGVR